MSNTAPSRADPVVVFPLGRWCPPQETSQPHPPQELEEQMHKIMSWTICGILYNSKTRKFAMAIINIWTNTCIDSQHYFCCRYWPFSNSFHFSTNLVFHWLLTKFTDFSLTLKKYFFIDFSLTTAYPVETRNILCILTLYVLNFSENINM